LRNYRLALLALLIAGLELFAAPAHAAEIYYIDNGSGCSDSGPGTSPGQPWCTVGPVNAIANGTGFAAGSRILFRGGQSFKGNLSFGAANSGTASSPIVLSSYGTGRATLYAGDGYGIWGGNTAGILIKDLVITGSGAGSNQQNGIHFENILSGDVKLDFVHIDNVEVSGFGYAGITLVGWNGESGYRNIRITNSAVHDNGDSGVNIFGMFSVAAVGYAHQNLYIGSCKAYNNAGIRGKGGHSGDGIVIGGVDGAVIERSVAFNNGALNTAVGGPVGIWAWDSNSVIIQYNEAYGNKTNSSADGGGFDLDGGVTNSIMQYNYSHDNDGAGYLFAQFGGARPFRNNVIRYNISQNDGRKNGYGGIMLWNGGSGVRDNDIYNNTVFVSPAPGGPAAIVFLSETDNIRVRNNILISTGGADLVRAPAGQSGVIFQGNSYWTAGGAFHINWQGADYRELNSWRSTGQEMLNGSNTGFDRDPLLTNPGAGGSLGDASLLPALAAYQLQPGSPLIDAGLDLRQFGLQPGSRDYSGNAVPSGRGFDIGAREFAESSIPVAPTNLAVQ